MLTVALMTASPALGRELIPAYFSPGGDPNPWFQMCDNMDASGYGSTAIMAPAGDIVRDPSYVEAIRHCHERGQNVIGYVATGWTQVSLQTAEAEVDAYYSAYPRIDGIFVDEMGNDPSAPAQCDGCTQSTEQYYQALYSYIHAESSQADVIGNPGIAASTPWQLDSPAADEVVTFEGSSDSLASYTPPAWVLQRRPDEIANLIYGSPSSLQTLADCQAAQSDNAGLVYVTDASGPPDNPWGALPSDWPAERAAC